MSTIIPEWSDWLKMTEAERIKCKETWDAYKNEGQDIVEKVIAKFKEEYCHTLGLEILGKGICHGGTWVISVGYPFVFDKRKVPNSFLGIDVRATISNESLPEEFQVGDAKKEYIWAPERYEKFVDKYMGKIRRELGDPNMDKTEMLNALCGKDFNEYVQQCKEWEKKGIIPSYQE